MKQGFFILLTVLLSLASCRSIKGMYGDYESSGKLSYTKLSLNDNGTFIQIRNFEGCQKYFYGTYKKKGKFIKFTPEDNRADLMYKEDYIIQGYDANLKEKRLYVNYQGKPFEDSLEIQFSNGKSLYLENGFVVLPADFAYDSISVFGPYLLFSKKILLQPDPKINLYFFVYNNRRDLIGCWDWLFINQVKIKNRNLVSIIKRNGKSLVYKKQK
jgi:hypothetical protein